MRRDQIKAVSIHASTNCRVAAAGEAMQPKC